MLADRRGWATFIGTPKGKNEFFRLYESAKRDPMWFQMMLKASESGIISSSELADLQREMGEDQYQQEFECSFEAAIKGAFYADEMRTMLAEGRIRPIEIEKEVRVHTAWDLGVSDFTVIRFIQCVGRERRLVDYYEGSGVGLDHYAQVLHDKRIQQGWKYGYDYFPHDITVRKLSSGISRVQSLAALGIEAIAVPQSNVLDGINLTRRMLGRTWIDCNRCERGIEALRQYRREYDDKLKDWRRNPLHDWHVLMRCAHLPAVITSPQQAPRIPFVADAASTHGDPLVRLKKKRLIRLNRRRTNKPPNGSLPGCLSGRNDVVTRG